LRNGGNFFVGYQWTRNSTANTTTGLVPTADQRAGDLSTLAPIIDPTNGTPFLGNIIPDYRISPQAKALLNLYPLPNFTGGTQYNYQIPIVTDIHQDSMQGRWNKPVGRKNQLAATYAF